MTQAIQSTTSCDAEIEARPARERTPADRKLRVINLCAVVVPLIGLVAAMTLAWGRWFDWSHLIVLWAMATVTAGGITVGYHRLCTHRSFSAPAWVRYALAAAGSMAVQGAVFRWAGEHRRHHHHSDTEGDPHSPHKSADGSWGEGIFATARGFFHAHVGWLFRGRSRGLGKYIPDLKQDRALSAANRHFPLLVLAGLGIPAVLGGVITWSWMGVLLGFLWGGLVRILLVHHITWSVNSVCHLWGTRPFAVRDESRNNPLVAVLSLGEGWHNNHHAFPASARHGLRWWELDPSYVFIRLLGVVGLARDIRTPDRARVIAKRAASRHVPEPASPGVGG
ncbi:MAG: fatty acid desaturase [Phycisphaerales bacterium]|nr:fatty acid desaturase [Phycisphaerales bacterium]